MTVRRACPFRANRGWLNVSARTLCIHLPVNPLMVHWRPLIPPSGVLFFLCFRCVQSFDDGDYIIRQGEEGTRFFIINEGEVGEKAVNMCLQIFDGRKNAVRALETIGMEIDDK